MNCEVCDSVLNDNWVLVKKNTPDKDGFFNKFCDLCGKGFINHRLRETGA